METIKFDLTKNYGGFKPLNATNGGPFHRRHENELFRSNFVDYKKARIPYSRNHDSNMYTIYGGPFGHDISAIFPNFDADENKPDNYDFANTDECILCMLEAGTKTFFRLGQSLERQIKKHNTLPPKDFAKWARICEHIIRHYTEGWADGFTHDMPYWEIWNEPDMDDDESKNKRCWGGTKAQFFNFYEVVAKHLKTCFPNLKIGGPALAYREDWAEDFLAEMQKRNVPIDFFSWHIYAAEPFEVTKKGKKIRSLLDNYGYEKSESILDEWNYISNWTDRFVYSIETIDGIKGAAFLMSVISEAQKSSIDMLMYYATTPSVFNGIFDFYTLRPLKGYYPFSWYGEFYDYYKEIRAEQTPKDIYTVCGMDKDGKVMAIITHYTDDDNKGIEKIKVDFGKDSEYEIYLLDKNHDGELLQITKDLSFEIPVFSCIKIKER